MPAGPAIRFWYALYNLLLWFGVLVCAPFWVVVRLVRGRYRGQFRERMGILSPEIRRCFGDRPAIWIHAASAGETASAVPLVRMLKAAHPDVPFLFTVTSRYGKEMAQRQLGETVEAIAFSPLDLPVFDRRFLDLVQPRLYLMVETDLWPNLVRMAKRRGARVAVASGHAGQGTLPRSFWRAVFTHVDRFWMQSETDAVNIVRRGAASDCVEATGNFKFDSVGGKAPADQRDQVREEFGMPEGCPVLVAGSVLAEDEGPVLDAIAALRKEGLDLCAIVAPRRQERVSPVVDACAARGLEAVRRTQGGRAPILILDTMGELARSYNLASVAYVGGGLTPEVGLHNLIEPLVCGAPVLFGPHHGKAWRIAAEIQRLDAGLEIEDGAALLPALRLVLTDPVEHRRLVDAGTRLLELHQGATARVADRIERWLA